MKKRAGQYAEAELIELEEICSTVRAYIKDRNDKAVMETIEGAMGRYPHSAVPHNLMGIWLESRRDHLEAMKHFRAANALEPTYLPAIFNLDYFGSLIRRGHCAFTAEDCPEDAHKQLGRVEYDERKIGRIIRRRR